VFLNRGRTQAIAQSSQKTTIPEMPVAIQNAFGHRSGAPRPVNEPSSDKASAKAMLMPAPTDAARPTRKVSQLCGLRTPPRTTAPASRRTRPSGRRIQAAHIAARTSAGRSRLPRCSTSGGTIASVYFFASSPCPFSTMARSSSRRRTPTSVACSAAFS
jgi:hypothetical protein